MDLKVAHYAVAHMVQIDPDPLAPHELEGRNQVAIVIGTPAPRQLPFLPFGSGEPRPPISAVLGLAFVLSVPVAADGGRRA